ncbi:DNA internalization-related competence protein ComEC/Rec2 [Lactobacillus sp. ESL0228]|uniref:DNA internalization-related competence protein ComEC/Rec2 n=1 Tax=Lactobacillus sp. ESL0228 TaxID=2069352 RepID=UPI000EFB224E|nr:DNA internalization-related competence protein ComEC/Rec2 [Lactobacillus sp. ESL0228]RMC48728.1 DNA internalization-related competence protein ComEC/Rec2 [Lactobacillus sp. ESL0228]
MRLLKTNWKSDILIPGFLFITSLLFIDLSFLIYQCSQITQKVVCCLIGLYLIYLLLKKYPTLIGILEIFLTLAILCIGLNKKQTNFSINDNSEIKLYPDQIKINDNWLSGTGQIKGGHVLVTATISDNEKKQLKWGHRVVLSRLDGEVKPIESATNYGQFDLKKYYLSKNITQQVKLKSCHFVVEKGGLEDCLHHFRFELQSYFKEMPQILNFFSSELILGENPNSDNQEILDNYRDLGVIHILSISGLHVGIYTMIISTLCYIFKLTEDEAFSCCLIILAIGVFLSNGQAGFVRASLTFILSKLFKFKRIPISQFDLLGLTCLLHLLIDPRLMMKVGALLSYVLSLGLVVTGKLSNFKQSVALNILLAPLLLCFFFQFNLLTVIFNLLIVPYFNLVIMPLTFFNLVIYKIDPALSGFLEMILESGERVISTISSTKLGLLTFGKINWWQCLLLLILTTVLIADLNEPWLKKINQKKLLKTIGWLYFALFILIHFPLTGQVTFIDVGQGDSILITTPFPRRVYLIDTGGKLNFSGRKVIPQVNKITIPLLKAQGITHLNGIFVTHQDADHVGDLGPLLSQIPVQKLYVAQGILNNPSFCRRIAGRVEQRQIVQLLAGQQINEPQIKFNVVYPFKPGIGENKDCLSLTFKLANKSWLFTGDLGQEGEQEIMAKYNLQANYFKLGHHGSRTSSNPEFLHKLAPEVVFISAGRNNRFNHPHSETLTTLKRQGIPWASTQDCGMITWNYGKFTKSRFIFFLKAEKEK